MEDNTLDLKGIFEFQREFAKRRDWEKFHTPKNLAMALAGEAGELVEIFQWLSEAASNEVMADPEKARAIRHELADILNYTLRLADVLGVDIPKALWEKFELNEARYPADRVRGSSKKYTEYQDSNK